VPLKTELGNTVFGLVWLRAFRFEGMRVVPQRFSTVGEGIADTDVAKARRALILRNIVYFGCFFDVRDLLIEQ
jgi:hypothetical protein